MKALTFKEKQDVLEDLFKKYHRAVLQLKCLEERNFYPSIQFDTVKEKKMYYQDKGSQLNDQLVLKEELEKVIATFEFILDCLSMESKIIIEKEFIERVGKDWWIDYCSRSTYYRLKTRAMEETLFYFSCL